MVVQRKKNNACWIWVLVAIILLIAGVGGFFAIRHFTKKDAPEASTNNPGTTPAENQPGAPDGTQIIQQGESGPETDDTQTEGQTPEESGDHTTDVDHNTPDGTADGPVDPDTTSGDAAVEDGSYSTVTKWCITVGIIALGSLAAWKYGYLPWDWDITSTEVGNEPGDDVQIIDHKTEPTTNDQTEQTTDTGPVIMVKRSEAYLGEERNCRIVDVHGNHSPEMGSKCLIALDKDVHSTKFKNGLAEFTGKGTKRTLDDGKNVFLYTEPKGYFNQSIPRNPEEQTLDVICEVQFKKADDEDYYQQSNVVRCDYRTTFEETPTDASKTLNKDGDLFERQMPDYTQWEK